jgi:tetratricopeptide (TPR) repeat protein
LNISRTPHIPKAVDFYFDKAIQHSDKPFGLLVSQAIENRKNGQHTAAIEGFAKALGVLPENPVAADLAYVYLERGITLRRIGDIESALGDLNKSISLVPSVAALLERGISYRNAGEIDLALSDLDQAIRLGPTADAYLTRGDVNFESKKYSSAYDDFQNAALLDDQLASAYGGLAKSATMLGNDVEAEGHVFSAISRGLDGDILLRQILDLIDIRSQLAR